MEMNLIEAAKEVVSRWDTPSWKDVPATAEYINRLRAAIEEAEKSSPTGFVSGGVKELGDFRPLSYTSTPIPEKQEPVAEVTHGGCATIWFRECGEGTKLYTHPAPAVENRDYEKVITEIGKGIHYPECWDTAAYPTLGSALDVVFATFQCTNEDTHPAPAVPEGWQLVPKEPTFEMIHAGTPSTEGHYSLPVSLYKSMLASAPKFGEKE